MRAPESVRTLLAAFPSIDEAGAAVSAIIAAGVVPAAIEMMDALAIEAAEAAVQCGYPAGAGAVLVVELDGPHAEVEPRSSPRSSSTAATTAPSRSASPRTTPSGRCSGRAASRRSPRWGGSAPTTSSRTASSRGPRCPRCCAGSPSCRPAPGCGSRTSSTPATATCTRWCSSTTRCRARPRRREKVSAAILDLCIEHGGSITGEHGVGADKVKYMPRMFTDDDLDTMQMLRCAFDPAAPVQPRQGVPDATAVRRGARPPQGRAPAAGGRAGRGVLTCRPMPCATTSARSPGPGRPADPATPSVVSAAGTSCRRPRPTEVAELLRVAARHELAVVPRGSGSTLGWGAPPDAASTWSSTPGASAGSSSTPPATWSSRCARVRRSASSKKSSPGPVSSWHSTRRTPRPTVGGTLAVATSGPRRLLYGTARDLLIGITFVRADGVVAKAGGKVVKNVAGYDFGKLLHRLLRHARRHHRGCLPAAPAAGGPAGRDCDLPRRAWPPAPRLGRCSGRRWSRPRSSSTGRRMRCA